MQTVLIQGGPNDFHLSADGGLAPGLNEAVPVSRLSGTERQSASRIAVLEAQLSTTERELQNARILEDADADAFEEWKREKAQKVTKAKP